MLLKMPKLSAPKINKNETAKHKKIALKQYTLRHSQQQ
jgi:hypothetical protein